jgi:transcriptional repressor NrdR
VDEAIASIEEKLVATGEKEITSDRIGELVMRELKRLDKVAYIRFASVYRSFADIESFESALKELK